MPTSSCVRRPGRIRLTVRPTCTCRAPRRAGSRPQAGVGELLLTHIPPWTSREDVISEAKAEFGGPVHAVVCGETFNVGRS